MKFPIWMLKQEGLRLLSGKWNSLVLALFIPFLIYCCFAVRLTMNLLDSTNVNLQITCYMYRDIGTLLFCVLLEIITVGIYYNLNENREKASFFSIYGFGFGRFFQLLPFLIVVLILPESLGMLLSYANTDWLYDYLFFSIMSYPVYQGLLAFLGIVIQIAAIYLHYSFLLAPCILAEHPEYSGIYAMKESFRLSRGKRFYLFWLSLSFIGWMFLGMMAVIGILWVLLYLLASRYAYYKRLSAQAAPIVETDPLG